MRDNNFLVTFGWMRNRLGLKGNKLRVFALIYGFSQDGESCFSGSFNYIAEMCDCCRKTAANAVGELIKQGFIKKLDTEKRENTYVVCMDIIDNLCNGNSLQTNNGVKITPTKKEECKNYTNNGVKITPTNNIYNNINNINTNSTNKTDRQISEIIDGYTDNNDLREALRDFVQNRKDNKKPVTPKGFKKTLNKLTKFAKSNDNKKIALLDEAIEKNWLTVYDREIFDTIVTTPSPHPAYRETPELDAEIEREERECNLF